MDVKGHPPPTHHADTHAPPAARASHGRARGAAGRATIGWEEGGGGECTGEEERAGRGGEEGERGDVPQVGARAEVAGGSHGRGGVAGIGFIRGSPVGLLTVTVGSGTRGRSVGSWGSVCIPSISPFKHWAGLSTKNMAG